MADSIGEAQWQAILDDCKLLPVPLDCPATGHGCVMTVMWAWEASAPGTAAAGVCDDIDRARRAASRWMRAHGADAALLEEVRLAIGVKTLLLHHERTGVALHARRYRDGRVRWRLATSNTKA